MINNHGQTYETRGFTRFDEQLGYHRLTQEINLTNTHLTDEGDQPSLRVNEDQRRLMLGIHDTMTWGDPSNPYLLSAYVQYRGEPSVKRPTHLELGLPSTFVNLFSTLTTGALFGDVTREIVGPGITPLRLKQDYISTGHTLRSSLGLRE